MKKLSSPHYLKILMKLSKHDISYSLKRQGQDKQTLVDIFPSLKYLLTSLKL